MGVRRRRRGGDGATDGGEARAASARVLMVPWFSLAEAAPRRRLTCLKRALVSLLLLLLVLSCTVLAQFGIFVLFFSLPIIFLGHRRTHQPVSTPVHLAFARPPSRSPRDNAPAGLRSAVCSTTRRGRLQPLHRPRRGRSPSRPWKTA